MNWKPGDHAIIAYSLCADFIGRSCVVLRVIPNARIAINNDRSKVKIWPMAIDVEVSGFPHPKIFDGYAVKPEWLRKPDEGYDGTLKTSWNRCDFKPAHWLHAPSKKQLETSK